MKQNQAQSINFCTLFWRGGIPQPVHNNAQAYHYSFEIYAQLSMLWVHSSINIY